jgi:hypothetical protein
MRDVKEKSYKVKHNANYPRKGSCRSSKRGSFLKKPLHQENEDSTLNLRKRMLPKKPIPKLFPMSFNSVLNYLHRRTERLKLKKKINKLVFIHIL